MSADRDFYLSVGRAFDNLFSDAFKSVPAPAFFDELYSVTSFPPTDVYLDKDKNLTFELSVSGYTPEDILIEATGDYLIVSSEKKVDEENDGKKFLRQGIKRSKFIAKYFVPSSKYCKDEIKANYKNGILKIVISPLVDTQPKKVKIEL
jgi:HSP20 family protein